MARIPRNERFVDFQPSAPVLTPLSLGDTSGFANALVSGAASIAAEGDRQRKAQDKVHAETFETLQLQATKDTELEAVELPIHQRQEYTLNTLSEKTTDIFNRPEFENISDLARQTMVLSSNRNIIVSEANAKLAATVALSKQTLSNSKERVFQNEQRAEFDNLYSPLDALEALNAEKASAESSTLNVTEDQVTFDTRFKVSRQKLAVSYNSSFMEQAADGHMSDPVFQTATQFREALVFGAIPSDRVKELGLSEEEVSFYENILTAGSKSLEEARAKLDKSIIAKNSQARAQATLDADLEMNTLYFDIFRDIQAVNSGDEPSSPVSMDRLLDRQDTFSKTKNGDRKFKMIKSMIEDHLKPRKATAQEQELFEEVRLVLSNPENGYIDQPFSVIQNYIDSMVMPEGADTTSIPTELVFDLYEHGKSVSRDYGRSGSGGATGGGVGGSGGGLLNRRGVTKPNPNFFNSTIKTTLSRAITAEISLGLKDKTGGFRTAEDRKLAADMQRYGLQLLEENALSDSPRPVNDIINQVKSLITSPGEEGKAIKARQGARLKIPLDQLDVLLEIRGSDPQNLSDSQNTLLDTFLSRIRNRMNLYGLDASRANLITPILKAKLDEIAGNDAKDTFLRHSLKASLRGNSLTLYDVKLFERFQDPKYREALGVAHSGVDTFDVSSPVNLKKLKAPSKAPSKPAPAPDPTPPPLSAKDQKFFDDLASVADTAASFGETLSDQVQAGLSSPDIFDLELDPEKTPSPAVSIPKSLHEMKEIVKSMKPNVSPRGVPPVPPAPSPAVPIEPHESQAIETQAIKKPVASRREVPPAPSSAVSIEPHESQAIEKSVVSHRKVSPRKVPSPAVPIPKSLHKMKEMVKSMKPNVFPRTPPRMSEEQVRESKQYKEGIQALDEDFELWLENTEITVDIVVTDFKERFPDSPAIIAVADRHLAEMAKAKESYDWEAYSDALRDLIEFLDDADKTKENTR